MTTQLPIPKERLESLASGNAFTCVQDDEATAMARALLAAYEQEPAAWQIHTPLTNVTYVELNSESVERVRIGCAKENIEVEITPLYAHPAPSIPAVPDYFAGLVAAARVRADKAMRKFPQPNYVLNKVAEESGEVIKAVIHYTEGREEWANVESEIIDNLAMLIRLVTEGDQVIGFTPPEPCRAAVEACSIKSTGEGV